MRNAFSSVEFSQSLAHRSKVQLFGEVVQGGVVRKALDNVQCQFFRAHGANLLPAHL